MENQMGYMKNILIEGMVEEPDRLLPEPNGEFLTRRKLKAHRRETYRAPKHWVVTNRDMAVIWLMVPANLGLGFCLGLIIGGDLLG